MSEIKEIQPDFVGKIAWVFRNWRTHWKLLLFASFIFLTVSAICLIISKPEYLKFAKHHAMSIYAKRQAIINIPNNAPPENEIELSNNHLPTYHFNRQPWSNYHPWFCGQFECPTAALEGMLWVEPSGTNENIIHLVFPSSKEVFTIVLNGNDRHDKNEVEYIIYNLLGIKREIDWIKLINQGEYCKVNRSILIKSTNLPSISIPQTPASPYPLGEVSDTENRITYHPSLSPASPKRLYIKQSLIVNEISKENLSEIPLLNLIAIDVARDESRWRFKANCIKVEPNAEVPTGVNCVELPIMMTESLNRFLTKSADITNNLYLAKLWIQKYNETYTRFNLATNGGVNVQISTMMERGNLQGVVKIFDESKLLSQSGVYATAQDAECQFLRAQISFLQGNDYDAMIGYGKAFDIAHENEEYALHYAKSLQEHSKYEQAESVYLAIEKLLEPLKDKDPSKYISVSLMVHRNLAILYSKTQRLAESNSEINKTKEIEEYSVLAETKREKPF